MNMKASRGQVKLGESGEGDEEGKNQVLRREAEAS